MTIQRLWQRLKPIAFHPFSVLAVSIGLALVFALMIITWHVGEERLIFLLYNVPIAVPLVAFGFDRAKSWDEERKRFWLIDLPVLVLALARNFLPIPLISGHALFLSYALLTTRSRIARIAAMLVLLEVSYMKIFLWHDVTLIGGVVLGLSAAFIHRWLDPHKFRVMK